MLLVLFACDPGDERELRVLSSASGDPEPNVVDDDDTGGSSGEASFPEIGCGLDHAWGEVPSALTVQWCTRLSPEAGSITDYAVPDTGAPADTGLVLPGPPPPCGFTNLVGNLGLVAGAVLYCDADREGGTRLARLDDAGIAETEILASEDCVPDPAAGQLVLDGENFLAAWAGTSGVLANEDNGSTDPGLSLARVDAGGTVVEGPTWAPLPATAHRVAIAGGGSQLAGGLDYEQSLSIFAFDDHLAVTESVVVATGVGGFSLLADGEGGAWLATCPADDSAMVISRLGAALTVTESVVVEGSSCGWFARPSLALHEGTLLAGWVGAQGAGVVALDSTLTEAWRLPMAGEAGPQVARGTEGWVVLGGDGALSTVSDAGEVLATLWHPGVVDVDGSVVDLRLQIEGNDALVVLYGLSTYTLVTGHVNTFNYVEASRVSLP